MGLVVVLERDGPEVDLVKSLGRAPPEFVVGIEDEVARRNVMILRPDPFKWMTAVDAIEEQAIGLQQAMDSRQYKVQVGAGHMEQAVEGEDGVEWGRGKIKMQKIYFKKLVVFIYKRKLIKERYIIY